MRPVGSRVEYDCLPDLSSLYGALLLLSMASFHTAWGWGGTYTVRSDAPVRVVSPLSLTGWLLLTPMC